jgi:hypothetical protein
MVTFEAAGGDVAKWRIKRRHIMTVVAASRVLIIGDCKRGTSVQQCIEYDQQLKRNMQGLTGKRFFQH